MKIEIPCLLLFVLLGLVSSSLLDFTSEWHSWKTQHGRVYSSWREELARHRVWLGNREFVENHNKNADGHGYTLALNHFGDLTDEEFAEKYLSYSKVSQRKRRGLNQYQPSLSESLPQSVDWRTANAVTAVQDQEWCGSSYAFSAVGAIEGAWAIQRGSLQNLSAQNIVDCSVVYGNLGCLGGNMYTSFEYVYKNSGIDDASYYPYTARESSCAFVREGVAASINGSKIIEQGNEGDLQAAVAQIGPVSVAVDASDSTFRFYQKGVYDAPSCSRLNVNHAMLVVGYGNSTYQDYWIVKNSWGSYWGMSGYIMMTRNSYNQCGIATDASFPTLRQSDSC